jgi:tetratricopeptide (TPR) repeat protein
MSPTRTLAVALTGVALVVAATARPSSQEFGSITFPASGAPAAHAAFLTGVKALHNFQFDEAAVAFREAQKADAAFVMAYWGEAMSHNHPLWAQQDVEAAKKVLDRLDPSAEGRVAKAKTPKEKAFVEALHTLYFSPGDKLARDHAYSQAMARMHRQWPDDDEVTIFYALSLLGTVRPGDAGFRRQALAASLAQGVFTKNPKHPGAAHFVIHAFDDPDHAILALEAARAYAKIAPSAAHALHMPSHIFVQLGMWEDVAKSNVDAYKAAVDLNARMKLAEGREDFHTLSWLAYANTMLGRLDEAKRNVEQAKAAADRNPGNPAIRNGYLGMRARLISDTEQWEKLTLAPAPPPPAGDHANMPGMSMPGMAMGGGSDTWTYIVGVSAAKTGDMGTAEQAEAALRAAREKAASAGPNAYAAKLPAIREKELGAIVRWAKGQKDEALALAKEAADLERSTDAPSGPPEPIKPAPELYGELLLAAGKPREAAQAFEQQLLRTPNRTPSVKGLAAAQKAAGTPTMQ